MEAAKIKETETFFKGSGEMVSRINSFEWGNTPLGPMQSWPPALVTTLHMMLNTKVPMFLWWGDDLIQFYNDAYRPSLGTEGKHPSALGQYARDCWQEIWHIIKPLIGQVMQTGEPVWQENRLVPIYRNNALEDVYWTFSYSAILDEEGTISGVLVICSETTQEINFRNEILNRKNELQNALKNSEFNEANIRNLMVQAPVAMCLLQGDTFVVEIANDLMCELWGKSKEEVINKPVFTALPEATEQGLEQLLHSVYTTGERFVAYEHPVLLQRKGKLETVYINFVYEALRNTGGVITGIIAVATDVTSMVKVRLKVEESEKEFKQLADSLPHIVWTARPDGYIDYYNQQWYDFTGFDESYGDQSWMPILHPDDLQLCLDKYYHSIQTGEPYTIEYRFKDTKNGGYRWFLGKAQPIRDSEGSIVKWFGSCTDIDMQKSFSEKLEQKVDERTLELQRMNEELESFAYVASHDLQEPLRKIQTYSDRILEKEQANLSDSGKEYFRRLLSAASRMQILINDLLDYSRTNNTSALPEQTDLDVLMQDVLNEYKDVITRKEAIIENNGLGTIPVISYQFRQAMQNLIGNSLKFSRPGVPPIIRISNEIKSGGELLPTLSPERKFSHFVFSDNGIGFDPQYRKRIFEMFQRLNGRSEYEGTGIGLAIVNKIVENHKGIITADSEPGQGAVFHIYIPV